jgi:hypothetical protein
VIADEPSYVTGARRWRWDGPLVRLVFSPANDVELDLEWVTRVGVLGERGRGEIQSSDWGDVALRAKWRLIEARGRRPALGVRFGVILPETKFEDARFRPLGLGPNTLRSFGEALATCKAGPLLLHANLGLFLHDEVYRPHDQRDFISYGLALERRLTASLTAAAELSGRAGRSKPGAEARSETRAGVRIGRGRLRGDVALRRGLAHAVGTWGLTAGLAWQLR